MNKLYCYIVGFCRMISLHYANNALNCVVFKFHKQYYSEWINN